MPAPLLIGSSTTSSEDFLIVPAGIPSRRSDPSAAPH
jgi:hypothetical protein